MTGNSLGFVILAFVLYLLMMVIIGALYAKKKMCIRDRMEEDAEKICHVELAGEPDFQERFLKEMNFPGNEVH